MSVWSTRALEMMMTVPRSWSHLGKTSRGQGSKPKWNRRWEKMSEGSIASMVTSSNGAELRRRRPPRRTSLSTASTKRMSSSSQYIMKRSPCSIIKGKGLILYTSSLRAHRRAGMCTIWYSIRMAAWLRNIEGSRSWVRKMSTGWSQEMERLSDHSVLPLAKLLLSLSHLRWSRSRRLRSLGTVLILHREALREHLLTSVQAETPPRVKQLWRMKKERPLTWYSIPSWSVIMSLRATRIMNLNSD